MRFEDIEQHMPVTVTPLKGKPWQGIVVGKRIDTIVGKQHERVLVDVIHAPTATRVGRRIVAPGLITLRED